VRSVVREGGMDCGLNYLKLLKAGVLARQVVQETEYVAGTVNH
jgi:hypothetical protein